MNALTLALPKGRMGQSLVALLRRADIDVDCLLSDDRRLVRQTADGTLRFLSLKPDDVPTYVEYGAADLGVSGRDVLLERRYDLYQPLDLGIGRCQLVVAAPHGASIPTMPRVATKYPRIAREYFEQRGQRADIIFVQGSVELAPLVGLSHLIVDIVETGTTLAENNLEILDTIREVSSVVVANRALFKLRHAQISELVGRLRNAVRA